jgi:dynein heavy chain, axonemal
VQRIERLYVFAIMWSVGAFIEWDDRARLQEYLLSTENAHLYLNMPVLSNHVNESIFDYFVHEKTDAWTHWNTIVTDYVYPTSYHPEYASILVPNVDNVRTDFLLQTIAKQHRVRLFVVVERSRFMFRLACSSHWRARHSENSDDTIVHVSIRS